MTADTITATVQTVENGIFSSRDDLLTIEEPLQFCLNGAPLSITMRSPGSDLDLATGFLFTEGIIDDVGQILSMRAESAEDSSAISFTGKFNSFVGTDYVRDSIERVTCNSVNPLHSSQHTSSDEELREILLSHCRHPH
jgi:formate dehydrogenase assembly factor FdhD